MFPATVRALRRAGRCPWGQRCPLWHWHRVLTWMSRNYSTKTCRFHFIGSGHSLTWTSSSDRNSNWLASGRSPSRFYVPYWESFRCACAGSRHLDNPITRLSMNSRSNWTTIWKLSTCWLLPVVARHACFGSQLCHLRFAVVVRRS